MTDKKENKPGFLKGCGCGCLGVIILSILIVVFAYSCSGSSNNSSALEDAKATYDQIVDLNNNTDISSDEKVTEAQDLIDKITPVITELEKQKDEELPHMGRVFQIWQSYVSMNGACNAIVQNDPEYYQKCIDAAQESLDKAEKETD